MKTCSYCKLPKDLSEFTKDKNRRDGLKSGCRPCLTAEKREQRRRNPEPSQKSAKKWHAANREKRLEIARKYRQSLPIEVKRERYRRWAKRNPNRVTFLSRRSALLRKYGLSLEKYDSMLVSQAGVCAICCAPPTPENCKCGLLVVDHCHRTGKVRGLLCNNCNSGLGFFKENTQALLHARHYVYDHLGD